MFAEWIKPHRSPFVWYYLSLANEEIGEVRSLAQDHTAKSIRIRIPTKCSGYNENDFSLRIFVFGGPLYNIIVLSTAVWDRMRLNPVYQGRAQTQAWPTSVPPSQILSEWQFWDGQATHSFLLLFVLCIFFVLFVCFGEGGTFLRTTQKQTLVLP